MFQKFSLLFFILFVSPYIFAQDCDFSISGQIIDIHDNTPLQGAVISIGGTNTVSYSNENGYYEFNDLCKGELTLKVTHPYCKTEAKTIRLKEDRKINFRLEHHLEELNEVLLKGKLYNTNLNSSISNQIKTEELERFSSTSLGEALESISGVSTLNTGSSIVKPIIQGLHSSRVLIINDNVRLHDQQWGEDHAPNVDINSAANVMVIKGASALKYGGDAIAGVIVVEPRKAPIKDTLMGKTILTGASNGRGGTLSSSLIKSNLSGFNYRIQGSLKRLGDLKAPDYQLTNTGQRENNLSLGLGLNKIDYGIDFSYKLTNSEIGILRAAHIGNARDLVNSINRQEPFYIEDFSYSIDNPKQEVTHQIFKLNTFKKLKNIGEASLQYSFQNNDRLEFDVRRGGRSNIAAMDMNLKTHTLLAQLEWTQIRDFNTEFGIELNAQTNFSDPSTGVKRLIPDYDMYSAGIFATSIFELNENWKIDAGIRYDFSKINADKFYALSRWRNLNYNQLYPQFEVEEFGNQILTNPIFDYHNISGTVGATHIFENDWKLISNLSSASRAPNPSELFSEGLHHSLATIELGDLRLGSEQSLKVGIELQGEIDNFGFSLQPYYNYIDDFIILEPEGIETTIRGSFPVYAYRQTDARLFGIDVSASYTYRNFDWLSNFAYVNGTDIDRDTALINMPPLNLSNTLTYRKAEWNNFYLSVNSKFVAEQHLFPDNNFTTDIVNTTTGNFEEVLVDISTPPEAYHLLNFRSGVQFDLNSNKLSIDIIINNVLNTSYRDYLNRLRFYADEVGTNAMLQLKFNY
ncbi:TonB-dependent receptor [Psychroflexus sediminis]|uniref:Iron complex outermembrane recepter protein n=1 Tax=Psychroflexus sediminis TaxID=470826 RepID=A0A1G7XQ47_9FLAO|nr:TonB-dependent receptor [Psychroflexus sediminis]SDG86314.1 iron complex outermembrane recepter protein [Psychroflexus sediminis]